MPVAAAAYPARIVEVPALGDFHAVLEALDIARGSTVYVHSGTKNLGVDGQSALALIQALRDAVGPQGSIFMPSFTYDPQVWMPAKDAIFDVRRSPSLCGLVSELFRRQPDAVRSENFYVPVAGIGPLAGDVLSGQLFNEDLFGEVSVFGRLVAAETRLVGLGVSPNASSFSHLPDWELRDRLPVPLFRPQPLEGRVRTADGTVHATRSPVVDPRIRLSFAPWQMMDADATLGPLRRMIPSGNPSLPIYGFSYPLLPYVRRALELGTMALARGEQPPWLKPGTFALFRETA